MKLKYSLITGLIIVAMVIILSFNMVKGNDLKNEIIELEDQVKELENKNQTLLELEETKSDNTFEEDVEWFVQQLYGMSDRLDLYETIEPSITNDVTEQLFGENHPPEEGDQDEEERSLERTVENINVFGKFEDESHYSTLVTFDLTFEYRGQTDRTFTIVKVELRKGNDGKWLINEVEEFPNR